MPSLYSGDRAAKSPIKDEDGECGMSNWQQQHEPLRGGLIQTNSIAVAPWANWVRTHTLISSPDISTGLLSDTGKMTLISAEESVLSLSHPPCLTRRGLLLATVCHCWSVGVLWVSRYSTSLQRSSQWNDSLCLFQAPLSLYPLRAACVT